MVEERKEVSVFLAVKCGKISTGGGALVAIDECERCDCFGGNEKIFEGGNGLPELFEITCKLPTKIRAQRIIMGGLNDGGSK